MSGDGVVVDAVAEGFGYRIFHVQLFDSGEIVKVNRLEVEKIDTLDEFEEEMVCEDGFEDVVVEAESEDLPTIEPPKKKRFVVVESEAEIDDLADEQMTRLTQAQTRWAVKIFRGGYKTFSMNMKNFQQYTNIYILPKNMAISYCISVIFI